MAPVQQVQQHRSMADLNGRVALVTGAASGIGFGMVQAFLAEGARVVLADVDREALRAAEESLSGHRGDLLGVVVDVAKLESVHELARLAVARFGGVDVVCNNAGAWTLGYQWETSEEDWRWVVDVNLWGVIHGIQVFVPLLLSNPNGGHVVNTASIGGLVSGPGTGPYAATKHAVIGLSRSLRADLAARQAAVVVTIVCPGKVATPIVHRVNARPGGAAPRSLPDELAAVAAAMQADAAGLSPAEAGRIIIDAVKTNDPWVFPGADRHRLWLSGRSPNCWRHSRLRPDVPHPSGVRALSLLAGQPASGAQTTPQVVFFQR
jgi:NAD(P)-dependent dehydrogenase (short-subunit alcohol dehydrogenase family)